MDVGMIIGLIQESLFMILVFVGFLLFSMFRGVQAIVNLILGLYLALLISLKFPYYTYVLSETRDAASDAAIMILIFATFTILATILFGRIMTTDFEEAAFQSFSKKVIFSILATILVMAYSYHALPVTDIITPGSPIQTLFEPASHFFWWLMVPLVGIFFL
jgi:hypothetical protein